MAASHISSLLGCLMTFISGDLPEALSQAILVYRPAPPTAFTQGLAVGVELTLLVETLHRDIGARQYQ
ncbi:hypothetical protein N7535_006693 [Penicillium sp. DV-2018c]|nr:hypothetical protein N7461_007225 [Penicillium sp. DV-2018c]KAJ5567387.1 hypothetical protein N7535_006693 [Penicillium sp. DV-2018c]